MHKLNKNVYIILRRVFLFLPVLVLANIIFSFYTTDIKSFYQIKSFSFYYLGLSLLLGVMPWVTHSLNIKLWCNYLKYKIPYIETVRVAIGSDLGAAISPTAVGGSPIRAAMLISNGVKASDAVFMSLIATIEDTLYLTFSFFIVVFLIDTSEYHLLKFLGVKYINLSVLYYLAIIIPVSIVVYKTYLFRFIWINKVIKWFRDLIQDIHNAFKQVLKNGKSIFILSFILNVIQWLVRYIVIYTLLLSLGVRTSFAEILILGWFVYFVILFIPTPGAVLGAEAAFYLIFGSILSTNLMGLVTFGWRFLTFYMQLSIGVLLFLSTGYITIKNSHLSE